jgi:arginase family enzyme
MELGTVSAFLECFIDKEKMVIWIDVHADVNTREASKSGHYPTRMPVAFFLGLDKNQKMLLNSEQLIHVGLRDVDPF